MGRTPADSLIEDVLRADVKAIARLMRAVEDDAPRAREYLSALQAHVGRANVVGITGAPGTGKSTLIDQLLVAWRALGVRVGVLAIDPSSPVRGGALLGDRIRMTRHAGDTGIYIRSVASRGQRGGLALRAADMVDILDAAGMDVIVVETVGVGQDGVDIMQLAQRTVVVQSPGQGDDVQAMKAGILEIADILVVNKCDLDGAERLVRELQAASTLTPNDPLRRSPPILRTQAVTGEGVEALAMALLAPSGRLSDTVHDRDRSRRRLANRLSERVREMIIARLEAWLASDCQAATLNTALQEGDIDLETAAQRAVDALLRATTARTSKD